MPRHEARVRRLKVQLMGHNVDLVGASMARTPDTKLLEGIQLLRWVIADRKRRSEDLENALDGGDDPVPEWSKGCQRWT